MKTNIHKTWIFIRGYLFYGYSLQNVLAWISWLGYQCGYPLLYGQLKTDIQKTWISMLISVDFWKSMHGFDMDSRTREQKKLSRLQWTISLLDDKVGERMVFECRNPTGMRV